MGVFESCRSVQDVLNKLNDWYGDEIQDRQVQNDDVLGMLRSHEEDFDGTEVKALILSSEAMARDLLCVERRIVCIKQKAHAMFGGNLPVPPRSVDDVNAKYDHIPLNGEWREIAASFAEQFESYQRDWDAVVYQQSEIRTVPH